MAKESWIPANSLIGWNGFADGNSISAPAAPKIDNTPNPYAAMAAEMVGEIGYNMAGEYMAPESEWNEDLQKWVYTKKPFSSAFGKYEIPEDALWSTQVASLMKQKEIVQAKEREANAKKLNEFNSIFTPSLAENTNDVMLSRMQRPLTLDQAIKYEGFKPSMVPEKTQVDPEGFNKRDGTIKPTHIPIGEVEGGEWRWDVDPAPTAVGSYMGWEHADKTKGTWIYRPPSGKQTKLD
jgi:hypothetical protein